MRVQGAPVVFGRSELVSVLNRQNPEVVYGQIWENVCAYRLGGSSVFRDLALAIGSYDFTTSSGTVADISEDEDSSSSKGSGELPAAPWSEALRLGEGHGRRLDGTRARGRAFARYLDGSRTAIALRSVVVPGCRSSVAGPKFRRRKDNTTGACHVAFDAWGGEACRQRRQAPSRSR